MASGFQRRWTAIFGLRFVPRRWQWPGFLVLGAAAGMGLFVAHISRATSYLSDEPETCVNCHVMTTQYVTWQHSSHANTATCNDCHVPHDSLARHWAFKAKDGLRHAAIFTLRWEPQAIQLSRGAMPVVQQNCIRCHEALVDDLLHADPANAERHCWDCHRETPHGRSRSLSTTPDIFRPQLGPIGWPDEPSRITGRAPRP